MNSVNYLSILVYAIAGMERSIAFLLIVQQDIYVMPILWLNHNKA
jgi:hypothetical protein